MVEIARDFEKISQGEKLRLFKKMLSMLIGSFCIAIVGIVFICLGVGGYSGFSAFGVFLVILSVITSIIIYVGIKNYSFDDTTDEGFSIRMRNIFNKNFENNNTLERQINVNNLSKETLKGLGGKKKFYQTKSNLNDLPNQTSRRRI